MNKVLVFNVVIIVLSVLLGILLWPRMPAEMASHWDAAGEVDGFIPKFWGLFLMPIISVGIFLLLFFLPRLDPLKKNVAKFRRQYDFFILFMLMFLFYIYVMSLCWNLGYVFDMTLMMLPAIALLLFYAGVLLGHAERNWFIGVKTPWTLSSDLVWRKTNRLGGLLFKVCAFLAISGVVFRSVAMWLVIVPVLLVAVFLFVYSYVIFRRLKAR